MTALKNGSLRTIGDGLYHLNAPRYTSMSQVNSSRKYPNQSYKLNELTTATLSIQ